MTMAAHWPADARRRHADAGPARHLVHEVRDHGRPVHASGARGIAAVNVHPLARRLISFSTRDTGPRRLVDFPEVHVTSLRRPGPALGDRGHRPRPITRQPPPRSPRSRSAPEPSSRRAAATRRPPPPAVGDLAGVPRRDKPVGREAGNLATSTLVSRRTRRGQVDGPSSQVGRGQRTARGPRRRRWPNSPCGRPWHGRGRVRRTRRTHRRVTPIRAPYSSAVSIIGPRLVVVEPREHRVLQRPRVRELPERRGRTPRDAVDPRAGDMVSAPTHSARRVSSISSGSRICPKALMIV